MKRAEDAPDELVLRLYESDGRRAEATVDLTFPTAAEANPIEDRGEALTLDDGRLDLRFDPFE